MRFVRISRYVVCMLVGFMLCLGLSACAPRVLLKPVANPKQAWLKNKKALAGLSRWSFDGVVGGRYRNKAFNANINWQQSGDQFKIILSGPLSIGQTIISGKPGQVELTDYHGKVYQAKSVSDLMVQQLGWQVPALYLMNWIKGVPVNQNIPTISLNTYGLMSRLKELGWTVEYLDYSRWGSYGLPIRLKLKKDTFDMTIIINHWLV